MEFKYKLTKQVEEFIENANISEIEIGCSSSQVIKIEKENDTFFLKVSINGELKKEYEKLNWLSGKVKVPEIILYENKDDIEYLITKEVPGEMVCSDYYSDNWKLGIQIVVESFNELYNVDITNCPFNTGIDYKLDLVKKNIDNNLINLDNLSKDVLEKFKNPNNIYNYLLENKFEEELCFTHGDMSLPNIFAYNNRFSGFIDVGECGVADKWFDIAIAFRTIKRNYEVDEAIDLLFEQLGIEKDQKKIDYYLLLMELYI